MSHHTPRYFTDFSSGRDVTSSIFRLEVRGLLVGGRRVHFSRQRWRPLDLVKEFTNNACLEVSSIFDAMVQRSSAWAKAPKKRPLMLIPRDFDLISDSRGSMTRLNSVGERMDPWKIPRQMAKGSDI